MKRKTGHIVFFALIFVLLWGSAPMTARAAAPEMSKKTISISIGNTYKLKVRNAKGKITWSSSNAKVATVSKKGQVFGVKAGKIKIRAKIGKKTVSCKVTVKKQGISTGSITLEKGQVYTLKTVKLKGKATWSSSNKKIAAVSKKGKVTGKKAGSASIRVKVKGKTYICKVTVKNVYLNKTALTLKVGASFNLKLNGGKIKSVKSSNASVASVNKAGKITAKKAGDATVTVTSTNNVKYTCKVKVTSDNSAVSQTGDDTIYERNADGSVKRIEGKFSETQIKNEDDALNALQSDKVDLGVDDISDNLECKVPNTDDALNKDDYSAEYGFVQKHDGYEVYNRLLAMSVDSDGYAEYLESDLVKSDDLENANLSKNISEETAKTTALNNYSEAAEIQSCDLEIYTFDDYEDKPILVYLIQVTDSIDGFVSDEVFVSADSGKIIKTVNAVDTAFTSATASGKKEAEEQDTSFPVECDENGLYYMQDTQDGSRKITVKNASTGAVASSSDNNWNDATAVTAYANTIKVYDWYKQKFGLGPIGKNGITVETHAKLKGEKIYDNLFWDHSSKTIKFCDNSNTSNPITLASALDAVGHEYTHGVLRSKQYADLAYAHNYLGAINEGYADVFGCLIDENDETWTIGESWQADGVRSASNPAAKNCPVTISDTKYLNVNGKSEPDEIAHTDSSLLSHAAYLMYSYGISKDELANLWFKSMDKQLTCCSDFTTIRCHLIQAAEELGFTSEDINKINMAFNAEGISTVSDKQPKLSEKFASNIGISKSDITSIKFKTAYVVSDRKFGPWDFSGGNGTVMGYVDNDYTLYICNATSNKEVIAPSDMSGMFSVFSNLKEFDGEYLDTSSVTNMRNMFDGCGTLESLDVSGWDTSRVENMGSMFGGCLGLQRLDVSGWKTGSVTNMRDMFAGCRNLESLDVSGWKTRSVTNMSAMFGSCSALESLDVGTWDTSRVTDMYSMFNECSALESLDVSSWDTSNVTDMDGMFDNCSALTSLDVSGWDTSSVTDMNSMFYTCRALTSLDVSGWDTSRVTDMKWMFENCSVLTSLDVSGWDTSSVTDMETMFDDCSALTSLDASGWNTGSVTDMRLMFGGCSALTSLNVSGWDTGSVTDLYGTFYECSALTSLDVSSWDTGSAIIMNYMFGGCSALTSLDVSGWDTSRVEYMDHMFDKCSALTSLDVSGWNTGSVTGMRLMFGGCSALTSLNVSGWDTGSATDMSQMFDGCSSLASIYADVWNMDAVETSESMFSGCEQLVGGNGFAYDASYTDGTYAKINTESENGYFTYRSSDAQLSAASDEESADPEQGDNVTTGDNQDAAEIPKDGTVSE